MEHLEHFGNISPKEILPPLTGPVWGYRRKARLAVRYVFKKELVLVGFRERDSRYVAEMDNCEVLDPRVGHIISDLKLLIQSMDAYQQIPQIEVAIGDENVALIFRHLVTLDDNDKEKLISFSKQHNLHLYLQPAGLDSVHLVWPENTPERLHYQLPDHQLEFLFHPTDFIQVNAAINQQLVNLAIKLLEPQSDEQVLDLFCGLGNFTLPIARYCKNIIGIEGSETMVQRAQENAKHNDISNAEFYCADLTTDFQHKAWAKQGFDKILIDPPRSGALELIPFLPKMGAKRILYISCNPTTLARDSKALSQHGYSLSKAGILDMFPHTRHVESIALFDKLK